jgi:vesicle-fusing ATPase
MRFTMSCVADQAVPRGSIAAGVNLRKWAVLSLGQEVEVMPHNYNMEKACISAVTLDIDFFTKKNASTTDEYNSDLMAAEFTSLFSHISLSVGQQLVFGYNPPKVLSAVVTAIEGSDLRQVKEGRVSQYTLGAGVLIPNSAVVFNKAEGSQLKLTGKRKGKVERQSIINPDWDFSKMGVGGLDEEFNAIFRRAFASRVFPPEIMEQLGCSHVKGILLHGPPGTGKTLMARQIGKMLNATEPRIVNGPEILDKYVGESEKKIRDLFEPAEADEKRLGANSPLHIIIFDEIDAICKKRGSVAGSTGVNDTVVNQLLSKIDGVDQLNNILVIGMTNRADMIDEALTRPGRLEVSVEIGLPKEAGRLQIINIHTRTMVSHKKMAADVDLAELANLTKNFSGAEIEGLVRAAQSCALNRLVKADSKVEVDLKAAEDLLVTRADFLHALQHDVKPALGSAEDLLQVTFAKQYLSQIVFVVSQIVFVVSQIVFVGIRDARHRDLERLDHEHPGGRAAAAAAGRRRLRHWAGLHPDRGLHPLNLTTLDT